MLDRSCFTSDIDLVFCEIAIRRLERFRETGKTGWQNSNPFEHELEGDSTLGGLLAGGVVEPSEPAFVEMRTEAPQRPPSLFA
jgi:hypothetical protein